jgi:hypothetical protein
VTDKNQKEPCRLVGRYQPRRWRQYVHLKCWYLTTSPHGIITQKTNSGMKMAVTLMMEAARTSETLVNFYQTTWRYNPEDSHLHTHHHKSLRSYNIDIFTTERKSSLTYSLCCNRIPTSSWGQIRQCLHCVRLSMYLSCVIYFLALP